MADIVSMITAEASAQGVDPNLAVAVARQESGLNPNARGAAGEIGLFQLEPATAAMLGVNPYNLTDNIHGGVAYLRAMLDQFGEVGKALAAYNWGPGRFASVAGLVDWFQRVPASTQAYIRSILGMNIASSSLASRSGAATQTPTQTVAVLPDVGALDLSAFWGDTGSGTPSGASIGPLALGLGIALLIVILWS